MWCCHYEISLPHSADSSLPAAIRKRLRARLLRLWARINPNAMSPSQKRHDIVVVGASAGGVQALTEFIGAFPSDLPAAVFIVLHTPSANRSRLPLILNRVSAMTVRQAAHDEPILPGRVYVARPDRHLLLRPGRVGVVMGPKENGFRPAVDPLFRSAAVAYGPRCIGVVLSGNLYDGVAGLGAIKRRGGLCMAQDPSEALYGGMPQNAAEHLPLDLIAPAAELAREVQRLVTEPAGVDPNPSGAEDREERLETAEAALDPEFVETDERPGVPSGFGCPSCGGALFRLTDGDVLHFRCRVGHAWSAEALLAEQGETLESALWAALRVLEESAALATSIGDRLRSRGSGESAERFYNQAAESRRHAHIVRTALRAVRTPHEPAVTNDVRPGPKPLIPRNGEPYVEP
jgi:two-component system, chemotaxis family, protein-glutamate methylesterase/glutaminase